jgi:hypothetical protein
MNDKEKKAIEDGSLFVLNSTGAPITGLSCIWFVWYREKEQENDNYRILLKSMRSSQQSSEKFLFLFKSMKNSSQYDSGLGKLDMNTGKMVLLKPGSIS